jgi:hypothetical protein
MPGAERAEPAALIWHGRPPLVRLAHASPPRGRPERGSRPIAGRITNPPGSGKIVRAASPAERPALMPGTSYGGRIARPGAAGSRRTSGRFGRLGQGNAAEVSGGFDPFPGPAEPRAAWCRRREARRHRGRRPLRLRLLAGQQLLAYRTARAWRSQERKLRRLRVPRARATFGLVRDVVPAIPGHRLRCLLAFSQRLSSQQRSCAGCCACSG